MNMVKERRLFLGMTQAELARKVGLSVTQIANIETRGAIPRVDNAIRIANALTCWAHRLFPLPEDEG